KSTRGSGGGIQLARKPDAINVGEVICDMEPDFGLVECFRPDNRCVITPACRLPRMLDEALQAFLDTLRQYTLADLVTPKVAPQMASLLKIRLDGAHTRSSAPAAHGKRLPSPAMELIDIGCNLTHESFDADRQAVIEAAQAEGVSRMIVTGATESASVAACRLAEEWPGVLYATAGIHPHYVGEL